MAILIDKSMKNAEGLTKCALNMEAKNCLNVWLNSNNETIIMEEANP